MNTLTHRLHHKSKHAPKDQPSHPYYILHTRGKFILCSAKPSNPQRHAPTCCYDFRICIQQRLMTIKMYIQLLYRDVKFGIQIGSDWFRSVSVYFGSGSNLTDLLSYLFNSRWYQILTTRQQFVFTKCRLGKSIMN